MLFEKGNKSILKTKKAENILLLLLFKVFMLLLRHSPLVFKIQAYEKKVLKETII